MLFIVATVRSGVANRLHNASQPTQTSSFYAWTYMSWPWRFMSGVYEACVGQRYSAIKGNSIARQHRSVVVWSLWIKVVEERNAERKFNSIQFSMHCWATPRIVAVWSCRWKRSKHIVCYHAQPGGTLPARAFTLAFTLVRRLSNLCTAACALTLKIHIAGVCKPRKQLHKGRKYAHVK